MPPTRDAGETEKQQQQAGSPTSSAKPHQFVAISTLAEMRKQGRPHPDEDWISKTRHPLFWEPLQHKPVADKLASMRAALDQGADPNMLDREPEAPRHSGRPLHCAIAAGRTLSRRQGAVPWAATRDNLPVVELLLERGADPRLPGQPSPLPFLLSPIEEAEVNMAYPTTTPGEDPAEVEDFYRRALLMMRAAAEKLDRHEAVDSVETKDARCQVS